MKIYQKGFSYLERCGSPGIFMLWRFLPWKRKCLFFFNSAVPRQIWPNWTHWLTWTNTHAKWESSPLCHLLVRRSTLFVFSAKFLKKPPKHQQSHLCSKDLKFFMHILISTTTIWYTATYGLVRSHSPQCFVEIPWNLTNIFYSMSVWIFLIWFRSVKQCVRIFWYSNCMLKLLYYRFFFLIYPTMVENIHYTIRMKSDFFF